MGSLRKFMQSLVNWPTYTSAKHTSAFERGQWPSMSPLAYGRQFGAVSVDEALTVSAVMQSIRILSQDLAGQPINVYVEKERGQREFVWRDPVRYVMNEEANPTITAQSFREFIIAQALIYGDGYAEIEFDGNLNVKHLWPLSSDRVEIAGEDRDGLVYRYKLPDGSEVIIPGWRMYHLPAPKITDPFRGESTVGRIMRLIQTALANEKYALSYYAQGARVGGVIKMPRDWKDANEEASRKAAWVADRAGVRNAHKDLFLPIGWDYTSLESTSAEDAQLIQASHALDIKIAGSFGIPAYRINIAEATQGPYGRSLGEVSTTYVRNTLNPWKQNIQQEANRKFFTRQSYKRIELDLTPLRLGDVESQARVNEILFRNGIISKNEFRTEFNYNDIPDGDRYDGKPAETSEATVKPDTQDAGDKTTEQDAGVSEDAVAAMAIRRLLSNALDRHVKRVQAREADLRKTHTNGVLSDKLKLARQELRERVMTDLRSADDLLRAAAGCPVTSTNYYEAAIAAAEQGGDVTELAEAIFIGVTGEHV